MIAITVELLHGTMRAGSADDLAVTGEPDPGDWPPSPARVFAALVAADGARERRCVTSGSELELLESAAPPHIVADPRSGVALSQQVFRYVVANATKQGTTQEYPARHATMVRPAPRLAPRHPIVTYVWRDVEPSADELSALQLRAARIGYIGCSDSPARVTVSTSAQPADPGAVWIPDDHGTTEIPVPFAGLLGVLDRIHDDFSSQLPVRRSQYRTEVAAYRPPAADAPEVQPVAAWATTVWLDFEKAVPARRALDVAETLKSATLATYRNLFEINGEDMPPILTGHVAEGARGYQLVQWVALPHVGREHADGRILGAVVMIPPRTDAMLVDRIADAVQRVPALILAGGRRVGVRATPPAVRPWATNPQRWSGPSRCWGSVYPVVHETHARLAHRPREVGRWFRHAGYEEPQLAVLLEGSPLPGAPRLVRSEILRSGRDAGSPVSHMLVVFDEAIAGPVVVGRGRQFGMGLMAPLRCDVLTRASQ